MPLITIVTIVKNNREGLAHTLASVVEQEAQNWELLIVLAHSIDGSYEFAQKVAKDNPKIKIIMQKSLGIFSAMNEGVSQAGGEYIWFMNSGDVFSSPKVLQEALSEIKRHSTAVVIGGYKFTINGLVKKYSFARKRLSALNLAFSRRGCCHQAMIFKTSYVKDCNGFSSEYKYNSDFLLVLNLIKLGGGIRVPDVYAEIEPGGIADRNLFSVHAEKHEIRREVFNSNWVNLLSILWTVAARFKIILRNFMTQIP